MRPALFIIPLVLAAPCLRAGEDAVLTNGYRLHAERHETVGDQVRLFLVDGVIELPARSIHAFEQDDAPVVPPTPISTEPVRAPEPAREVFPGTPAGLAASAARKYALPPEFVASVMETESAMRPDAISPKGAIGLMQLMPDTARQLGVNPHNPAENTEGGVRYLRDMLARFESSPDQVLLALAAYNAGPEAVERYRGVPPYAETRAYVLRVLRVWERRKSAGQ